MGDAYRIAGVEPDGDMRDWSHKFPNAHSVAVELHDRAAQPRHQGQGFRFRLRAPNEDFGPKRTAGELVAVAEKRLLSIGFGDVLVCKAEKDDWRWFMRKIKDMDLPINLSEANTHIDWIYTYFFRDHRDEFPGIESWGTCNRRFIDGTSDWSQHAPWNAPNPGCNAIDLHASYTVMFNISRRCSSIQHVAKVLFYNHEWTPSTGWIPASVGHYDHVHVEGPRDHGGLANACNY
jgi:hypothetical protein